MAIEQGRVNYNTENPENLSVEQAHQYIDDLDGQLESELVEENRVDDLMAMNDPRCRQKALLYWVEESEARKAISPLQRDFISLLIVGVSKKQLYNTTKGYLELKINKLEDIDKVEEYILEKISDCIETVRANCIPILGKGREKKNRIIT